MSEKPDALHPRMTVFCQSEGNHTVNHMHFIICYTLNGGVIYKAQNNLRSLVMKLWSHSKCLGNKTR